MQTSSEIMVEEMEDKKVEFSVPSRLHEVLGVVLSILALFMLLSLITYDGIDGFGAPVAGGNLLGPTGMWTAHFTIALFGVGSYAVDLFLWALAALLFASRIYKVGAKEGLAIIFLTTITSILAHVALRGQYFYGGLGAGGFLGTFLGELSISLLSFTGTLLLCVGGIILVVILTTDVSIVGLVRVLGMALVSAGQGIADLAVRVVKAWRTPLRETPCDDPQASIEQTPSPTPAQSEPEKAIALIETEQLPASEEDLGIRIVTKQPKKKKKSANAAKDDALVIEQSIVGDFQLPPLNLLVEPPASSEDTVSVDEHYLKQTADRLKAVLDDFSISGEVREIHPGPVVTMFEFQPRSGTKLSKIEGLSNELAMALEVNKVRVVAPIPEKNAVGFELPNRKRETVWLRDMFEDDSFAGSKGALPLSLGKDIIGTPYLCDLAKMPHLLIAGTTGSGKSVSVNTMLLSLLYRFTPEDLRLLLIDPKMIELGIYDGIPHLLLPVVTDMTKACLALKWAVDEMERRYQLFADISVRNLASYNRKVEKVLAEEAQKAALPPEEIDEEPEPLAAINLDGQQVYLESGEKVKPPLEKLPTIVIIIDELADLMMVAAKDVETSIARLAQKARAAGLHLIVATQRPSTDVITGLIKANFPARISFRVSSGIDSRTILGTNGAENLLGKGDMLVIPPGTSDLKRVHGSFVDEDEIKDIVDFLKQQGTPHYDDEILKDREDEAGVVDDEEKDEVYDQAVAIVAEAQACSISMLQRRLRIGYNRAARIVEIMEKESVVGPANGVNKREVLISQL